MRSKKRSLQVSMIELIISNEHTKRCLKFKDELWAENQKAFYIRNGFTVHINKYFGDY